MPFRGPFEGALPLALTLTLTRNWSIGRMIVRWQINTQMSRAVNDVPYRLAFGQLPRVGISALPLSATLLSSLSTEADLNQALS